MICEACKQGKHSDCSQNDCECPEKQEERMIKAILRNSNTMAEVVFKNLLYSGSEITQFLTKHAGSDNVISFAAQVIQAYRALQQ